MAPLRSVTRRALLGSDKLLALLLFVTLITSLVLLAGVISGPYWDVQPTQIELVVLGLPYLAVAVLAVARGGSWAASRVARVLLNTKVVALLAVIGVVVSGTYFLVIQPQFYRPNPPKQISLEEECPEERCPEKPTPPEKQQVVGQGVGFPGTVVAKSPYLVILPLLSVVAVIALLLLILGFLGKPVKAPSEPSLSSVVAWSMSLPEDDPRRIIINAYKESCDALSWKGIKRTDYQTTRQYERIVAKARPEVKDDFKKLTRLYEEARFSYHAMRREKSDEARHKLTSIKKTLEFVVPRKLITRPIR